MPIYEYVCKTCDHRLDALQKIADAPLVECPSCGEPQLRRLLSAPRFRLKGQGWYETDFKKENQRNIAGDKEAAKSDDKSEAKPTDGGKGDAKPKVGDGKSDKSGKAGDSKSSDTKKSAAE